MSDHLTYRGWRMDADYSCPSVQHTWTATHPDFDGPEDPRHVHAATQRELMAEIDAYEDDDA